MTSNQIHALTDSGYALLETIADDRPDLFWNSESELLMKELKERADQSGDEEVSLFSQNRKWTPQRALEALVEDAVSGPSSDAEHARFLRQTLPTMTPADMSDKRVLASICCFHLSEYVNKRWQSSKLKDKTNFVKLHWLGNSKESNALARIWWLYEFAQRAAPNSAHDDDVLLEKLAGNPTLYHQMLRRPYLMASDRIRAAVLDVAISSGLTAKEKVDSFMKELYRQLNRVAGGISLDVLSDTELREKVEDALPPK